MKSCAALLLLCLVMIHGCKKNDAPGSSEVLTVLKEIQELATVEYTVSKVVKANDNQTWFKPGDRKILITAEAVIKAGINLDDINEKDILTDGEKITIYLPQPRILSVNLPPEKIKVVFEKTDFLRYPYNSEEREMLMRQAEHQIRNSGDELGITEQAKVSTQVMLSKLLLQLGFTSVHLRYDKPVNQLD